MSIKLLISFFSTLLVLFIGCERVERESTVAVLQVAPKATLEEIRNDVRVRIFVERFLRDECRVVEKSYETKDLYLLPNQSACRYEIEVLTTTEETVSLTVDLQLDGSMSIPMAKYLPRGENRSRAIDASDFVAGPLEGNFLEPEIQRDTPDAPSASRASATLHSSGQPTGQSSGQPTVQVIRRPAASSSTSAAPQSNPRKASGDSAYATQKPDPNADKVEAYLADWLKKEHMTELESFLLRGREPTTFNADRYYTQVITTDDSGFEVTVDVYREDGQVRVFRARKIF